MQITPEIQELNAALAEFDAHTAYEFDRETNQKTLLLYAAAFSPRGRDLVGRLARAFRAAEKASESQ